jgi:electron transfer flavoprotein beta subunit
VPDTKRITGKVMNDDGTVNRAALPAIFNPEDLNALEMALQIKDKFGGRITAISMGPPAAAAILRESLFRGADDAILISDPGCAASDTLATSYILSCAIKKLVLSKVEGLDYDIVLCGRQAIDGDTAQVGPQLAEKLGITQITYVEELIELAGKTITVQRNIGNGWQQVRTTLPVLLTVTGDANEPRVAAAKKMMKYKNALTPMEVEREVRIQKTGDRKQETENRITKNADGAATVRERRTDDGGQRTEDRGQKTRLAATPAVEVKIQNTEDGEAEVKKLIENKCGELKEKGLLIQHWDLKDIGADLSWCGQKGSPTKVHRIQSVVLSVKESKEIQPTDEGIANMIHELIEDKIIS